MAAGLKSVLHTVALSILAMGALFADCYAQGNPRVVLYQLIEQLQTGTSGSVIYSPELREVIAQQTGNTGVYRSLLALGRVTSITMEAVMPMSRGTAYSMVATHSKGASTWQIGVASATNRIEYLEFRIGNSAASSPSVSARPRASPAEPRRDPAPAPSPTPTPGPVGPTVDTSPACQKFPNLC